MLPSSINLLDSNLPILSYLMDQIVVPIPKHYLLSYFELYSNFCLRSKKRHCIIHESNSTQIILNTMPF